LSSNAVAPVPERERRVCIVAPSLGILGGQAVVAQRLIDRLRDEPSLNVTFLPHNPRLPGGLNRLQRIKYVRTIVTSIAYVWSLIRHLRRHDVVHVFSASYWSFILAPTPAVLIGRAYGKKVILNYRSGEAFDHLSRWPRTSLPILRRAHNIVVPSDYLVEVFSKFGLKAEAVCNFVDVERIPFRERSFLRPVFLANRNFAALYNVSCVLRAFARIQAAVPDARLLVAGDGEQRGALHALAGELGLRNIEFLGQVSPTRMAQLYDEADIYLNSPNIDNMPNSIVEAFAAGIPVVTTNAGGIPFIVTHDVTGLMADCDDDERLATLALELLSDESRVARLTSRAREEVLTRYTWPAVREGWRRLYGLTT
jgi:glycosyltransferase involved in cell wall biosynthesis